MHARFARTLASCLLFLTLAFAGTARAQTPNYSDIWWNPAESGWGIQIAHSGTALFATWYTYDQANRQTFLILDGQFTSATVWSGSIYKPSGSSYTAQPYDATRYRPNTALGTITITFNSANSATLRYTVGSATVTKAIERFPFSGASSGNYPNDLTDLYYNASQSGWGVSLAQRGSSGLFGVIYHYDTDGAPLFFTMSDVTVTAGVWRGTLYRTTSSASNFLSASWNTASIGIAPVGNFDLTPATDSFALRWTANGITQTVTLQRLLPKATTGNPGTGNASECFPDNFFTAGVTWSYTYFTPASGVRSVSTGKANGTTTFNGQSASEYETNATAQVSGFTQNTRTRSYVRRDNLDVLGIGQITDTSFVNVPVPLPSQTLTSTFNPAVINRFSLAAGQSFTQSFVQTNTGLANNTLNITRKTTFVGIESVTVGAGTFQACRFQDEDVNNGTASRIIRWETKAVGLVKQRDDIQGVDTVLEQATVNGRSYP